MPGKVAKTKTAGRSEVEFRDRHDRLWRVTISWAEVHGRMACVGLSIDADEGLPAEVTTSLLRELNVGGLIAGEREKRLNAVRQLVKDGSADVRDRAARQVAAYEVTGTQGTRKPDEFYEAVADTYRAGLALPAVSPTKHVAQRLGGSRTQAAKWVQRARERGLLEPAPGPGRSGLSERRQG